MGTVPEIIDKFGGAAAFGKAIGVKPSTASEMKRRGSIPVRYWPDVLSAATERGIRLDNDVLVEAHTNGAPMAETAESGQGAG